MWKRHNARLAYEWDVDQFEMNEPDRPEFFGTKVKPVSCCHRNFDYGIYCLLRNTVPSFKFAHYLIEKFILWQTEYVDFLI